MISLHVGLIRSIRLCSNYLRMDGYLRYWWGDSQAAKPIRLCAKGPFPNIPATIGTVVRTPTPNSAHPAAFRLCLLKRSEIRKPTPTPRATRVPAINAIFGIVRLRSFIRLFGASLLPSTDHPSLIVREVFDSHPPPQHA